MCWLLVALLLLLAAAPASPQRRHLRLFGWHLQLHENLAIRSPYYNECKFYRGRVLHEPGSAATVTECGRQLYGLLQIGGQEFVVQPAAARDHHELRRRDTDAAMQEQTPAYDLSGDTVSDLDLDMELDAPRAHVRPRHSTRDHADYFRDQLPVTRPVSGAHGLWLEMAIVADHTMLKFHGRERVKHYILALMNIVSAIFNDPSLDSNMTLVINKLFLYEDKDPVIRYGNMKKSLEAVNKWNHRHLMKLPTASTGWDAAVWLSRAALGGPSGFAPVAGVCSRGRAAAVVRDEGLTSAFVIAHELGHLLGLTHDNEEACSVEANRGSVMAPTVLATLHNYTWSKCSRRQFHEKSRKWWCLHGRSGDEGVELGGTRELSNYVFTMDEQCRNEFGEGFSVCKSVKVRSACSRLWCAHRVMPHVCRSKRGPPLEGTPCGHHRWCVDRVCETMPGHGTENGEDTLKSEVENREENRFENRAEEENSIPQWSEWGAWEECAADCGYGLRMRRRHCRHGRSSSEAACGGASWQVSACWAGPCAATRDARADACARQRPGLIPHLHGHESTPCENWCVDYKGGEASSFGLVPDGVPCSYERPFDVCHQGACIKGECDPLDAACNWCPDGYCNNNTHYYTRTVGKGWTRLSVIPHDAHQLSVNIATPVPLHIAIRERKRDKPILELSNHQTKRFEVEQNNYLKYDPNVPQNLQIVEFDSNVIDLDEAVGWEGQVVAGGTLLKWRQTESNVLITAVNRLHSDLMIMAIPEHPITTEELVPVEVTVNYSTPATRTRPLEYRWSVERGPCSASCGGGVRVVRTRCLRADQCAPPSYERCNLHTCEFVWAPGEWEGCSSTCGEEGVQERQLYCVPTNASTSSGRDLIRNSVSPALCSGTRPDNQQPCNRLPCPAYWQEMAWTPCSATCGRGISRRPLFCPASAEALCGPRPRERRRRCRARRCPARPTRPTCPANDATQYCELFTPEQLRRNCAVPPFQKYCCNACLSVDSFV